MLSAFQWTVFSGALIWADKGPPVKMKVSDRSIDSEAHLVAFPTDPLNSSTHLLCHKGQRAFHGCSVPFNVKHKHHFCFKLNFIYPYAEGQELTSIDSYGTYVHARAWPVVAIELLALHLRIRDVSGSSLGPEHDCLGWKCLWVFSVSPGKCKNAT
jgi:hypothetical protein